MSLSVGNFQCALWVALMSSRCGASLLCREQMALKRACRLRSELSLISGLIPSCDSSSLGREAVAFFSFFFAGGSGGSRQCHVTCMILVLQPGIKPWALGSEIVES